MSKLVSVIIPVYNVEKYVDEAITSIINQTYENIELIVIDDGSSDRTYDICRFLASKDPRVKLFKNERNLKIVKTLNYGLSLAKGSYIARMDGDDISEPDRIEKKVRFLEKNLEIDLVGCSLKSIDMDGQLIGESIYSPNQELLLATLKYSTPVSHIWVARRHVYDQLNGYRELSGVEDYDFLLRMTTLGLKYSNLEDYFGYYVRLGREGNTIESLGIKQRKMRKYAYSLFLEREKYGKDSFSLEFLDSVINSSTIGTKLYSFSAQCLARAIRFRGHKCYFRMIVFLLLSLVSTYQVLYLYDSLIHRLIVRSFKK